MADGFLVRLNLGFQEGIYKQRALFCLFGPQGCAQLFQLFLQGTHLAVCMLLAFLQVVHASVHMGQLFVKRF